VADPVNGSWSYGYDKFSRISSATCNGSCPFATSSQTLGFTYDQYGNRWTQTATPMGYNPMFQFDTNNRIKPLYGVIYDADGNLTNDGNGNTFSFDPEGKLTAGGECGDRRNCPQLSHRLENNMGTLPSVPAFVGPHLSWSDISITAASQLFGSVPGIADQCAADQTPASLSGP